MTNKLTKKTFWGVQSQLTSIRILSRSPMKTKNHGVDSVWTFQLSTVLILLMEVVDDFSKGKLRRLTVRSWVFAYLISTGLSVGSILVTVESEAKYLETHQQIWGPAHSMAFWRACRGACGEAYLERSFVFHASLPFQLERASSALKIWRLLFVV